MKSYALVTAILGTGVFLCPAALYAAQPEYTTDGQLKRPANFREWIYLSSGLGMTYGLPSGPPNPNPAFDNVFVEPNAYRQFLKTGYWPEKTMLAMEVRQSESKGSINNGGHFQGGLNGLEVLVKDSKRYSPGGPDVPTSSGAQVKDGWAFFAFDATATTAKVIGEKGGCNSCHRSSAAVEHTFVQFYPTLLPVAKAKGTLKLTYITSETH